MTPMQDEQDYQHLCQALLAQCIHLAEHWTYDPKRLTQILEKWMGLVSDFKGFIQVLADHPKEFAESCQAYSLNLAKLCQSQVALLLNQSDFSGFEDKRFQNDLWLQPFFAILAQHFLLIQDHLELFWSKINFNDDLALKRIRFFMQLYLDALAPNHSIWTNPEVLAEIKRTNGINLLKGLLHFFKDIDPHTGRWTLSMTDRGAFQVGRNIAITPGSIVYRNRLIELIQYTPQTPDLKAIPLLIIPPCINKYYILDLSEENSLVRWLVSQGIMVFMISWHNPSEEDAQLGLEDYVHLGPGAAIEAIQAQLNIPTVSALGFCIGGTLLTLLLAYHKANKINSVQSATFLASMIDFSEPGDLGFFMHEEQICLIEKHMQEQGYLEGAWMAAAFNTLRAKDLIWPFFVKHYLQGQEPQSFNLLFWNADATNLPYKMHSEYLRWMYLNNDLVKIDKIIIGQSPIDVRRIDTPAFFLSTQKDHIAPWKSTYQGFQLFSGQKRFVLGGSGHIAGIVIPPGQVKYGYYCAETYPEDPEQWLAQASYQPGSWWPEWLTWLIQHSGPNIPAPAQAEQVLMAAPGTYVFGTKALAAQQQLAILEG